MAGCIVGSPQEVKARAVEIERDLRKAQETFAVSGSHEKVSEEKRLPLTEELSSVCVDHANLCADFDGMSALEERIEEDVGKSLSSVSTEK